MEVRSMTQRYTQLSLTITLKGGKSAVLSALQIALGARTYLTGRGTNLKAFIKEGRE